MTTTKGTRRHVWIVTVATVEDGLVVREVAGVFSTGEKARAYAAACHIFAAPEVEQFELDDERP